MQISLSLSLSPLERTRAVFHLRCPQARDLLDDHSAGSQSDPADLMLVGPCV